MTIEALASIADLRARLAERRAAGDSIALVPTMGYLHAGHVSLVRAARAAADCVVMSIFVNPLQFAPGEDFDRYPRDLARDQQLAADAGVDMLFVPSVAEMYPIESSVRIIAGPAGTRLEGAVRPGHFDGVLTVVAKLFNIVGPAVACFGQKDIQQFSLIRTMVRDLDFPIQLIRGATVREEDGLAMSSRNVYLAPDERVRARALSRALRSIDTAWRGGESDPAALARVGNLVFTTTDGVVPDYLALVDPDRLEPVERVVPGTIVAVAARVGRTRLIDNIILGEP